jgi:hypothetical protein
MLMPCAGGFKVSISNVNGFTKITSHSHTNITICVLWIAQSAVSPGGYYVDVMRRRVGWSQLLLSHYYNMYSHSSTAPGVLVVQ